MNRTTYYEPMIQEEQPQMVMRGFPVLISGTYVLLDDVVTALRAYARSLEAPNEGAAVHEAATWLSSGEALPEPRYVTAEPADPVAYEVHGAEADDVSAGVDRIEVYPDPPDDPKPKWYARSIDTSGFILKVTGGSFDHDFVLKNASERWPGIPIHELKSAMDDSKWVEDSTRGVFPSKGPPIRRLWGT